MKLLLLALVLSLAACGGDGGDDEDAAREILDANGVPTNGCSGGNVTIGGNASGSVNGGCNTVAEEEEEDDEDAAEVGDPGDLPRFQTPTPLGF